VELTAVALKFPLGRFVTSPTLALRNPPMKKSERQTFHSRGNSPISVDSTTRRMEMLEKPYVTPTDRSRSIRRRAPKLSGWIDAGGGR
jgi:hypothetical protein